MLPLNKQVNRLERTHATRLPCYKLSDSCKSAPPRHHHRRIRCKRIGRSCRAKSAALRLGLVAAWRRTHIVPVPWYVGCSLKPRSKECLLIKYHKETSAAVAERIRLIRKSPSVCRGRRLLGRSCRGRNCPVVPKRLRRQATSGLKFTAGRKGARFRMAPSLKDCVTGANSKSQIMLNNSSTP